MADERFTREYLEGCVVERDRFNRAEWVKDAEKYRAEQAAEELKRRLKEQAAKADLKPRGLKAPLYLLPFAPLKWAARGFQFGISPGKYERGNWRQPVPGEHPIEKAQEYLRATVGHCWDQMQAFERFLEGVKGGGPVPPHLAVDDEPKGSRGPHLMQALCSLIMCIAFLVEAGLAPDDPGKTWEA